MIPIALDILELIVYRYMYEGAFVPAKKIFTIKLGFISEPPSVKFLLEDFPSTIFQMNENGMNGLINKLTLLNILLLILLALIGSFIHSGYLSTISKSGRSQVKIRDFFILGNKHWHKFFALYVITFAPFLLMIVEKHLVFLILVSILFLYVPYSFVIDEERLIEHFKKGMLFLFSNFLVTIKMAIFFGFIFLPLSIVVYLLSNAGTAGIIVDIVMVAYLGAAANKVVLEVYRELREGE